MKPQDVANAITQALVQGGSQWLVATIVAFLPALWTMALILHLGRPYVLRTLRRCGLRLGADVWWMSYLLMRDAILLMTFGLSFIFFQPNIVASAPLPITGPLAALCLLLALAVKLSRRVDDDVTAYRLATAFLVLGATLYYLPLVFAIEANSQVHLSWFQMHLTSSANPTAALWIMWISLIGVAGVAVWLFLRALASANRTMIQRMQQAKPTPRSNRATPPAAPGKIAS
jgi:Na+-transporting methylmalonyl-CoA/oxaloacetate decarboxylase gamma subunit